MLCRDWCDSLSMGDDAVLLAGSRNALLQFLSSTEIAFSDAFAWSRRLTFDKETMFLYQLSIGCQPNTLHNAMKKHGFSQDINIS